MEYREITFHCTHGTIAKHVTWTLIVSPLQLRPVAVRMTWLGLVGLDTERVRGEFIKLIVAQVRSMVLLTVSIRSVEFSLKWLLHLRWLMGRLNM